MALTVQSQHWDSLLIHFPPSAVWILWSLQTDFQFKRKTREKRLKAAPADLLLFQKSLEGRIQLFEEEKEMESIIMNKVVVLSYADPRYKCIEIQRGERRPGFMRSVITSACLMSGKGGDAEGDGGGPARSC